MKLLIKLLIAGGAVSAPAFTVTMTALSNASGVVTTLAYINPGSGGGGGGVITPSIVEARSSGVAPLSVFFDASGTTAASLTSKPFHELVYVWSFGDTAGGATWTNGARAGLSKNQAFGPVASHVFETDGSYTVTLTVFHFDSGGTMSSASTTKTITVSAADTVFSGTNTICFSTSGTFTGAPSGATQVTTSSYDTAVATYRGTGKRLLFRGGETFTSTGPAVINITGPGIVGSFGTGNPIFIPTTNYPAINLSNQASAGISDWRLMDIEIDGQDRFVNGVGYDGGIDKTLLLRINIHNTAGHVSASYSVLDIENADGNPAYHGHTVWDELALVDCTLNTINAGTGAGGMVGVYIGAKRLTIMGCQIDSAGGGEHVIRFPYIGRGVLSNNYIARPWGAGGKHCIQLHGPSQSATGVTAGGLYSEKLVMADNSWYGDTAQWNLFFGPQNTGVDERLRDVIFERNYLRFGTGTNPVGMMVRGGVSAFTVRNNIINGSLSTSWAACMQTANGGVGPTPSDIQFLGNTFYSAATTQFDGISIASATTTAQIKNNLGYAPNNGSSVMTADGSGTATVATNSSNAQLRGTSPLFSSIPSTSATQLSATDFKITAGSYAIDTGTYSAGVYRDFQDVVRTLPADIGAVQA